ncbi:MAG: cell division protein FtsA [Candidatus Neomarinimicrobiota bacterium]
MTEKNVLCALDIGTTKICAVIGEFDASVNEYHIRGIGKVGSTGMKNGVVVDIKSAKESIEKAIQIACDKSGIKKITGVTIGIAGNHIQSYDNEQDIPIRIDNNKKTTIIKNEDLIKLEAAIRNMNIGIDREIIHIIPQQYIINDNMITRHPIGMSGNKLKLKAHVITADSNNVSDLKNCIEQINLNVDTVVLEPLASAQAVLTHDQKSLGVCLIDIGGGTTDITIFKDGYLVSTNIIGYGGQIITRDIATLAQTSFSEAERIKKEYAFATVKQAKAEGIREFYIKPVNGKKDKALKSDLLSAYVEARIREILLLAKEHIKGKKLNAGIVLTGGGSLLRGIDLLAKEIIGMDAEVGYPIHLSGLEREKFTPDYAMSIGLLQSANENNMKRTPSKASKSTFGSKIKAWLSDLF